MCRYIFSPSVQADRAQWRTIPTDESVPCNETNWAKFKGTCSSPLLEIIVVPAGRRPLFCSQVSCFSSELLLFTRPCLIGAAINPVDVEIIAKCKCRNTGNEVNPFCHRGPAFFSCLVQPLFVYMSYGLSFTALARWMPARWNRVEQSSRSV